MALACSTGGFGKHQHFKRHLRAISLRHGGRSNVAAGLDVSQRQRVDLRHFHVGQAHQCDDLATALFDSDTARLDFFNRGAQAHCRRGGLGQQCGADGQHSKGNSEACKHGVFQELQHEKPQSPRN